MTSDILIIGGGVIGLTTALRCADRGAVVTVLERGEVGREASWAGAGILPPGNLLHATTPEARLRSYSHKLWPEFAADLLSRTGIDTGFHVCGSLLVSLSDGEAQLQRHAADCHAEGIHAERLQRHEIERHVADLNDGITSAVFLPECGQIRNPRHLQALKAACLQRGVELAEHADGCRIIANGERISEVRVCDRRFSFDQACITAGAWSNQLLEPLGFQIPVHPVRGQIAQLQLPAQPFRCIIEDGRRYIVPRRDGLILVGSTEEHVGFVKQNTTEGVAGLLEFATSLVPALARAEVVRTWSGLRPGTPDELPLIGRVPGFRNLFVGAGHFRSGLQMSVGTGTILSDLMLDHTPAISLSGFSPERFRIGVPIPEPETSEPGVC